MEMCQWNWVIGVYRLGEHVTMLQTDQSVLHSANGQLPKANGKSKPRVSQSKERLRSQLPDLNLVEQLFSYKKCKAEGRKANKQGTTISDCRKRKEHLKGGNTAFGDVHGF